MDDKDFIEFVQKKVHELTVQSLKDNETARIDVIILKNFRSKLLEFIKNSTEEKITFTREMITIEKSNYDLRQEMSDEMTQVVLRMGYQYIEEESTSSNLLFQKVNSSN